MKLTLFVKIQERFYILEQAACGDDRCSVVHIHTYVLCVICNTNRARGKPAQMTSRDARPALEQNRAGSQITWEENRQWNSPQQNCETKACKKWLGGPNFFALPSLVKRICLHSIAVRLLGWTLCVCKKKTYLAPYQLTSSTWLPSTILYLLYRTKQCSLFAS